MKIIGSVKEDLALEKRISITPIIVKKFTDLKFSVFLEKNYGQHLGIDDRDYQNKGAILYNSAKEVFEKSDIILKVNSLSEDEINLIKAGSIVIAQFDKILDKKIINKLIKKKINNFFCRILHRRFGFKCHYCYQWII